MTSRRTVLVAATGWVSILGVLGTSPAWAQSGAGAGASDTPSAWTPAAARRMAEIAVTMVKERAGVTLDYTPQSLRTIDQIVLKAREQGNTVESMQRTLLVLGCYVGEVMVRHLGNASWEVPSGAERAALGDLPIGVRSANGLTNPIGKVYKLMKNGPEDSTYALYVLIADPEFRERARATHGASAPQR